MLQELINYIESIEFTVNSGLASGVTIFKSILEADDNVKKLTELCKDRAVAVFIIGHMLNNALKKFDEQYQNRLDTAQATYLHCVVNGCEEVAKPAIVAARLMRGTFWTKLYIDKFTI